MAEEQVPWAHLLGNDDHTSDRDAWVLSKTVPLDDRYGLAYTYARLRVCQYPVWRGSQCFYPWAAVIGSGPGGLCVVLSGGACSQEQAKAAAEQAAKDWGVEALEHTYEEVNAQLRRIDGKP